LIIHPSVTVPGMDGLLGLVIALLAFAAIIFLAGRTTRSVTFLGIALIAFAALIFFGVFA
jgi:hypothetical protein